MGRLTIVLVLAFELLCFARRGDCQTLGEAVNAANLTWTTSSSFGAGLWIPVTNVTHDGQLAAQGGPVHNSSQNSTLQTTVTGPGTLTFWWQEPDLTSRGILNFKVGGVVQTNIMASGGTGWKQQVFYLPSGTHVLQWVQNYAPGFSGSALGYLDEVGYTPGTTAPIITLQPRSQSQLPGMNVTFAVGVAGTPPFEYQWRFNTTNLPGANGASLIITNMQAKDLGTYSVTITNIAGMTNSAEAVLEFGEITAWGYDGFGQASVATGATNVLAISGGGSHGLALRSDRLLLGWGSNSKGQLNPAPDLSNVVAIAAGGAHSLALTAEGLVVAWGNNAAGETNVPTGLDGVVAVSAGGDHNLALKSDGTVVAWGWNPAGQTNVPPNLTNAVAVAAGDNHSLALTSEGKVVAWGLNAFGLTNVPSELSNVTAIAAGSLHSVALKSDGTVTVFGENMYGQRNVPVNLSNVVAIAAGEFHSLALRADGTVVAWGRNVEGQTNVPPDLTNVVAMAAGGWHNLALVGSAPPVLTATATDATWSNNSFRVSLPTQSGRVFRLEYRDALTDGTWTALPLVAGSGGILVLTDSSATNAHRFYRVRRW